MHVQVCLMQLLMMTVVISLLMLKEVLHLLKLVFELVKETQHTSKIECQILMHVSTILRNIHSTKHTTKQ